MKKATSLLLILLFLITSSGLTVGFHWCGGKLSSVDFFSGGKQGCRCGKKIMKPKCCKDKSIVLKQKTDSAKINQFIFRLDSPKNECVQIDIAEIAPSQIRSFSCSHFYRPPPDKRKVPIFLLDRVFLI